jgi:hypothetical protein
MPSPGRVDGQRALTSVWLHTEALTCCCCLQGAFKARFRRLPRQQHHVIPNFNHQTATTDFAIHQGGNTESRLEEKTIARLG